jgi:hypothetical protein
MTSPGGDTDRLVGTGGAALLALAMHAFVLAPLLLGVSGHDGAADARTPRDMSSATPLVFAGLVPPGVALHRLAPPHTSFVSRPSTDAFVAPQMLGRGRMPHVDLPDEDAQRAPAPASQVPVVVRRIGEITARIQGAWVQPVAQRAAPGAGEFHCRVRILQDEGGTLRALNVQQCDADEALRASVLKAIRASAPLPTRDDAENGAWDLTLEFTSYAPISVGRRSRVEPAASMP